MSIFSKKNMGFSLRISVQNRVMPGIIWFGKCQNLEVILNLLH